MNEEKKMKNKIGARSLTKAEAELILPTYTRIKGQIDQFRREKSTGDVNQEKITQDANRKANDQDIDQKTNNIGIIGVRGAGKTSVLKTIRATLLNDCQARNDVVLPIVVPENMSQSSTLMATILGMLSDVVREKENQCSREKNRNCIKKSELRIKCDEAIRQYTYIQKEYRDILIHEYTTQNDYVARSADVFNSDTEFIHKFNELVSELVNKDGNKESMLFVFIDDIDLSTYRCADVVKTLLSYLSNENIVTFISGDLETFEEALTLDFLRQEKVLENDVLEKHVGNKSVLDNKKQLAYEYLKKILPPVYRHNIKNWSLEEKANYQVIDADDEKGTAKKLSDLLEEALKGWVEPAFFSAMEEHGEESESDGKAADCKQVLPYTYWLFDNTSRGLNNVYNILNDILEKRNRKKENSSGEDYLREKKLLLDTLVSAKAVYNKHRDEIQKKMIRVSTDAASSKVFFDNAYSIIYQESQPASNSGKLSGEEKKQNSYVIEEPTERFALFLLVDFAARLLYEKEYGKITGKDEYYANLKIKAMEDLFFHPEVAEKVMETTIEEWGETDFQKLQRIEYEELSLKTLNKCFLLKGDLVLNLAYYKNFPLEKMLKLYGAKGRNDSKQSDVKLDKTELTQRTIISFWKALSSVAKVNGTDISEKTVEYTPVFTREFVYIRNQLSGSASQNVVIRMFDDVWEKVNKKIVTNSWEEQLKKLQLKRAVMNVVAHCLTTGSNEDMIQTKWQEFDIDQVLDAKGLPLQQPEQNDSNLQKIKNQNIINKKRVAVLKAISEGNLWEEAATETAVDYLEHAIGQYFDTIQDRTDWKEGNEGAWERRGEDGWKLNTSGVITSWDRFMDSYDGVSDTVSSKTKRKVNYLLYDKNKSCYRKFEEGIPFVVYHEMANALGDLARNYRVWYGRAEAQNVLDYFQQSYLEPENEEMWLKQRPYFIFLLQCYYKYKISANGDMVWKDAKVLANILVELSKAYEESDNRIMNTFMDQLNKQLSEETDIQEFEKMFSKIDSDKGGQS